MYFHFDILRQPLLKFLAFSENEPLLVAQIFYEMDDSEYEHATEIR